MPALGSWDPHLTVTVVVPTHGADHTLPFTLASLELQTYPEHLLDVVVVDDGSSPALSLPSWRPRRTRLVRTSRSWGRAHACAVGAAVAEGSVIHWLDADMLLHRDQVEAQMRWHHVSDQAVVLGHKRFVDTAEGLPDFGPTLEAVKAGEAEGLFVDRWTGPHEWVERFLADSEELTDKPVKCYLVHTGACASVPADLYRASGGMDRELKLGEDIELGYRLAQRGALFVPDTQARSWHLGQSTAMRRQDEVNRYNRPFLTDRLPDQRHWRTRGRSYSVPWVQAVVEVGDASFEQVRHTVNALMAADFDDLEILLVAPWSCLDDERRSPLHCPRQALQLVAAEVAGESRVRCVETIADSAFPAPFRLLLPPGWGPGRATVASLARVMNRDFLGLAVVPLPDGQLVRLERTASFERARRARTGPRDQDPLDALVELVSGTRSCPELGETFRPVDADGAGEDYELTTAGRLRSAVLRRQQAGDDASPAPAAGSTESTQRIEGALDHLRRAPRWIAGQARRAVAARRDPPPS